MKLKTGIGYQSYAEMMEKNIFYIDKTLFLRDWWEYADKVTLITRPRRFGKTLNMSTVECFFSIKYANRGDLFEGKSIWEEKSPDGGYAYRKLQGKYPVIFMSFADVKPTNNAGMTALEEMKAIVKQIIANEYKKYREIMASDLFSDDDRAHFASVNRDMDDLTASMSIMVLCSYLEKYYGQKAIILLDEYDTPMQEAWLHGYWDQAVNFFRNFFGITFKNIDSFDRAIITGITRIARESIFSDLNHLETVATTSNKYAAYFGFTEKEVFKALDLTGMGGQKQGVKQWYDGFTFGDCTDIYNPWSITSFIAKAGKYDTYWANTSSNALVSTLMKTGSATMKQTVENLIAGESFRAPIDEQIVFRQIEKNENAIWSLLLASGYLKVLNTDPFTSDRAEAPHYTLALTNLEVMFLFKKIIREWFEIETSGSTYNNFVKALLLDDVGYMNEFMNEIALKSFSQFDIAKSSSWPDAPERFYHGFVLGLMVGLQNRFTITSNRESGFGRYDVLLTPLDLEKDNAYIIEFKVHRPGQEKDLQETVEKAHAQIQEKHYEAALTASGIPPEKIRKYGFAFKGKKCLIG
ncbi:MAG: ATP-binding protein [Lachnospiraceae bacterium]|nr:ATP-binding protein [Lachnospiraceae bacterium]